MQHLLTWIVVLPLIGFAINGALSLRKSGSAAVNRVVTVVGCGLPAIAFLLAIQTFVDLRAATYAPIVDVAYTWASIAGQSLEVSFYFDRLTTVMALIVT